MSFCLKKKTPKQKGLFHAYVCAARHVVLHGAEPKGLNWKKTGFRADGTYIEDWGLV